MNLFTCQSCGIPYTKSLSGYNRDGFLSEEYCVKCFKDGEFVEHSLTMHQLEVRLLDRAKTNNEISLQEARQIIKNLPYLKRWKMNNL